MGRPLLAAVLTLSLSAVAAVPAPAAKHKPRTVYESPLLWASINVCDTPTNPDTVGIRGSMPGSGVRGEVMFMRFQAQYFSNSEQRWHNIVQGADSGWVTVGSARYKARQAGWSFRFVPPPDGTSHRLRGAVTFEWRKGDKVVRRARKSTTADHVSQAGADPPDYSAAVCEVS